MSKPTRSEGEPHDRKTRIANEVASHILEHAEYIEGDKAVVVITDEKGSGVGLFGFDDDREAVAELFMTLRAILQAMGKDIEFIGIPDDASGLDDG